jgi:hypothetical protein
LKNAINTANKRTTIARIAQTAFAHDLENPLNTPTAEATPIPTINNWIIERLIGQS